MILAFSGQIIENPGWPLNFGPASASSISCNATIFYMSLSTFLRIFVVVLELFIWMLANNLKWKWLAIDMFHCEMIISCTL